MKKNQGTSVGHSSNTVVSRSFKEWITDVADIDERQKFMLETKYLEEISVWIEWYKNGISPSDATKLNVLYYG